MFPLQEIHRIFTWFCICPIDGNITGAAKNYRVLFTTVHYVWQVTILCSSMINFLKYISVNVVETLYVFCQAVGLANGIFCITVGILTRDEINRLFANYQAFYAASKKLFSYLYLNS